jgi:hypothetical protein
VFDTTRSMLAPEPEVASEISTGPGDTLSEAESRLLDAFAQMTPPSVRPCFRPPCSVRQVSEHDVSPSEKSAPVQPRARLSTAARNSFTDPNRFHRPQGKS